MTCDVIAWLATIWVHQGIRKYKLQHVNLITLSLIWSCCNLACNFALLFQALKNFVLSLRANSPRIFNQEKLSERNGKWLGYIVSLRGFYFMPRVLYLDRILPWAPKIQCPGIQNSRQIAKDLLFASFWLSFMSLWRNSLRHKRTQPRKVLMRSEFCKFSKCKS